MHPNEIDPNSTIAITLYDHKRAALIFDYIVPIVTGDDFLYAPIPVEDLVVYDPEFPYDQFDDSNHRYGILDGMTFNEYFDNKLMRMSKKGMSRTEIAADFEIDLLNYRTAHRHLYYTSIGVRAVPVFERSDSQNRYLSKGNAQAVELTFSNFPIIDSNSLEWKQVHDIRKDPRFIKNARNFRLFIHENFQGKDQNYILDSLHKMIEDYVDSCKKHSIRLVTSTLTKTLDSKSLLGSLGLVAFGMLTGNYEVRDFALLSGAIIEIGKISVNIVEKKLEFKSKIKNPELSYLIEVDSKIG